MQVTGHRHQYEIQRDRDSCFDTRVKISERIEKSSCELAQELSDRPSNTNFFRPRRDHQFSVRCIEVPIALPSASYGIMRIDAAQNGPVCVIGCNGLVAVDPTDVFFGNGYSNAKSSPARLAMAKIAFRSC